MVKYEENCLKIYSNFNDLLKFSYNPEIYNLINLYKIADNLYLIRIDDKWIRGMLFLRCQEFYESVSDKFRNKNFTITEYINWYQTEFKNNADYFSYGDDYAGYNLPSSIIKSCLYNVKDPNQFDYVMKSLYNTIFRNNDQNFYLVGLGMNNYCFEHEIAHAFFNLYKDYKGEISQEISNVLSDESKNRYLDWLREMGYSDHVLYDEMQAYLTERPEFRKTFEKYFNKYI